jgi:hypothetical protein
MTGLALALAAGVVLRQQRARCLLGLALDGRDLPGGRPDHQISTGG